VKWVLDEEVEWALSEEPPSDRSSSDILREWLYKKPNTKETISERKQG
jgi:hypothetical protein